MDQPLTMEDIEDTLAEIAKIAPEDQAGYQDLLKASKAIYDVGFAKLSDQPFHQLNVSFGTPVC